MHSRGSRNKGTQSELPTSPLPSWGPTNGRNCYISLAFSVAPKQGNKIRVAYLTPAFLGAHKWAEVLRNPNKGTKSELVASPLPSRGPTSGQKCYVTPTFSGVPKHGNKIKSGYIGDKDKTVGMQPKRISPKKFAQMVCLHGTTTLKTPPQTILRGGGSETPHGIGFLRTPPPPPSTSLSPCRHVHSGAQKHQQQRGICVHCVHQW